MGKKQHWHLHRSNNHNLANNEIVLHGKWFPGGNKCSRKVPAGFSYIKVHGWTMYSEVIDGVLFIFIFHKFYNQ